MTNMMGIVCNGCDGQMFLQKIDLEMHTETWCCPECNVFRFIKIDDKNYARYMRLAGSLEACLHE